MAGSVQLEVFEGIFSCIVFMVFFSSLSVFPFRLLILFGTLGAWLPCGFDTCPHREEMKV